MHHTHTQIPRVAWGGVAPEFCGYVLLRSGQEEQKSSGFREYRTQGALSTLSRAATHEMTSPTGELGLDKQSPNC
ncbi:hypothetical protein LA080_015059 [Diaporthe eres]|nr:hypothetical protein LA080_015059 [Diaporthe eres]